MMQKHRIKLTWCFILKNLTFLNNLNLFSKVIEEELFIHIKLLHLMKISLISKFSVFLNSYLIIFSQC